MHLPASLTRGPLTIRLWEPTDAPAMDAAIRANLERLRAWMPWAAQEPLPLAGRVALIHRFRAQFDAGLDATYGIFLDGEAAGGTGLHQRIGPRGLEIGYWVAAGVLRRRVALTAAALLTEAGLAVPGVDRVEIHHAIENHRSAGVPRRLGYREVETRHADPLAPGLCGDLVIWRVTAQEATEQLRARWHAVGVR